MPAFSSTLSEHQKQLTPPYSTAAGLPYGLL